MTTEFYPLPETAQGRSQLLETFKPSWRRACFWVTLLFTRSWFPRQLKPAGRLLELWMGLGSVPVAFWSWVASFLAGSWLKQREKSHWGQASFEAWSALPWKRWDHQSHSPWREWELSLWVLAKLGEVTLQRRRQSGGCWSAWWVWLLKQVWKGKTKPQ